VKSVDGNLFRLQGNNVRAEVYAPWIAVAPWVNWFGVEINAQLPAKGTLAFGERGVP